jgi:hypothetical protein
MSSIKKLAERVRLLSESLRGLPDASNIIEDSFDSKYETLRKLATEIDSHRFQIQSSYNKRHNKDVDSGIPRYGPATILQIESLYDLILEVSSESKRLLEAYDVRKTNLIAFSELQIKPINSSSPLVNVEPVESSVDTLLEHFDVIEDQVSHR